MCITFKRKHFIIIYAPVRERKVKVVPRKCEINMQFGKRVCLYLFVSTSKQTLYLNASFSVCI